ncbi:uncharacterized protein LOC123710321 isoform X2 [Pieris brassicae]|uniref:uncharacterized protein LOC123710321 isoform X2 n=1 Tax=Pieris brassicae TaxID=7116 RepID=UPI001E66145E|nr:uncharacterized protein LOC123710321 isoform X2 [Pieris brassicae]
MFCKNILFILIISTPNVFPKSHLKRTSDDENEILHDDDKQQLIVPEDVEVFNVTAHKPSDCWPNFSVDKYFNILDNLDAKYAEVRQNFQAAVGSDNFDTEMLKMLVNTGGVAERTAYHVAGNRGLIPAGINLGGYCMMRAPKNVLFFHRMKLRNDTHFKIQYLHNDLENMVLNTRINLNDLHLLGSFDRAVTHEDPSKLFYMPTFGQAEFLLKNVKYKMEGRYRLLHNTLNLVLAVSDIQMDDVIMYHINESKQAARLEKQNIDGFLDRLKSDLNLWLKDYFNDYLLYFGLAGREMNAQFQRYDNEKAQVLNDFMDNAINVIIRKLHQVKAGSVKLPNFTIYAFNGMQLNLKNGVMRGLDSLYRRSVATGVKEKNIRKLDALVTFSNLKVTYGYTALLNTGSLPLTGTLTLSVDELVARLSIAMVNNPESADLTFEFVEPARTESLTVEGPANRMMSHFNFLLERHIIAIMSNTLIHNIKMLSTLSRCVPILVPFKDGDEALSVEPLEVLIESNDNTNSKDNESKEFEDDVGNNTDPQIDPSKNKNLTADYVLWKQDSVELEFPPKKGSQKKQKMYIKYNENFALGKINKKI